MNVKDNEWSHVAGVYDGTNIYLYINGVQYSKAPATGTEAVNYSGVRIGHISWIAAPRYFNGIIDEVAIFNTALSTEDIQKVMNKGLKESLSPSAVTLSGKLTTTWADIKAKI